ncbi:DNA internalization-related competence protein ComEC/Rec2 [Halomonas sp. MCCC 1A17488]|uniref:DNA internalization-related competence protein ComEC/Rec2 n=1 Tax=Billgrantia sulfidoxydans TaxID=2733484 RepID=A0ABX7W4J0_9GAMM|nr:MULTISPECIES: DNA internalization-related competence protein ComEC/Rec2 [Halomonas]MCE8015681.1 DNA internalization-related competence protein ComEC/Rec2 [Halomonas sp. MCCC 1A17488]MCG3239014.1 DNA internalization-related competence protein ComEC/Rec2 [Halomonas sp. MCCC 1A17488]QPP51035.1 DNA internalization-related competence protein ComEC/Rec2 [Halomonas sp. SS10-MC5]QTP54547.1 DNA internalization-related competence protein ComEC/Rec2 [Halomonas sulfidoxydans]
MAMPLALAVLAGVGLGRWAPPGLFEIWALCQLWRVARGEWRGVALGAVVALAASQVLLARGAVLPDGLLRADLALEGRIESVQEEGRLSRLMLRVESCRPLDFARLPCDSLRRVRLSYFEAPVIAPGERWTMTVRLRPPTGFANPGTFDYSAWLWREGIQATGYVRSEPAAERLEAASTSLRQRALGYLDERELSPQTVRWLAALTLGAGERLTRDDWDLLNASGTTHLMVISGLHVGLVAAFMLLVARALARLLTPSRWRMAVWPWWLAGVAAVGYAWLAGLQPPAMRAMIMTLVGLWVASGRHAPGPWQAWWLALGLVVLFDPLSAWRPGLWLSFLAVALLILIWQGRPRPRGVSGWGWGLLRTQLLLAPLMAAAVLLAFARLAPAAPLVNLAAVPLVSLVLVPLGLLGWLFAPLPYLGSACWWLFEHATRLLVGVLTLSVERLPLWWPAPEQVWPLASMLGLVTLLWALPGLARALRLGATLLLVPAMLGLSPSVPEAKTLRVRVLDVGQGQLIELRSANYRLLYDTGPRFASGFAPLSSVWPAGQYFDEVVVSHGDLDHAGGLSVLTERHAVGRFLAPPGESLEARYETCLRGQAWQRDGVSYRVLWPPEETTELSGNDRSCVLEVTAGRDRLLITGDVGRDIERLFLLEVAQPVTLLVAGHHGSRTSSGPQLVQWATPRHVIYSAARHGAFGHPHDEVVRRFRRAGSCQWNTALDGAVTFWLGRDAGGEPLAMRGMPWRRGGVEGRCLAVESRH